MTYHDHGYLERKIDTLRCDLKDALKRIGQLEEAVSARPGPVAAEDASGAGTCPALGCSHLWSLHGPAGCTGKVFPAHSLTGEPCRCEHGARP